MNSSKMTESVRELCILLQEENPYRYVGAGDQNEVKRRAFDTVMEWRRKHSHILSITSEVLSNIGGDGYGSISSMMEERSKGWTEAERKLSEIMIIWTTAVLSEWKPVPGAINFLQFDMKEFNRSFVECLNDVLDSSIRPMKREEMGKFDPMDTKKQLLYTILGCEFGSGRAIDSRAAESACLDIYRKNRKAIHSEVKGALKKLHMSKAEDFNRAMKFGEELFDRYSESTACMIVFVTLSVMEKGHIPVLYDASQEIRDILLAMQQDMMKDRE